MKAYRSAVIRFTVLLTIMAFTSGVIDAGEVTKAELKLVVAGTAEVFINGLKLAETNCPNGNCTSTVSDFVIPNPEDVLHNGRNVLVFLVSNTGDDTIGLSYKLSVAVNDGRPIVERGSDIFEAKCLHIGSSKPKDHKLPKGDWTSDKFRETLEWKGTRLYKEKTVPSDWITFPNDNEGNKIFWIFPSNRMPFEKFMSVIFRDYFSLDGLTTPTPTPVPTDTPAPPTITHTPPPVPFTLTYTPVPPTPTPPPPTFTYTYTLPAPPTLTPTLIPTSTPLPTPTPFVSSMEAKNINITELAFMRYYNFKVKRDLLDQEYSTEVAQYKRIEFLSRKKDKKGNWLYPVRITTNNGRDFLYDDIHRSEWRTNEPKRNILIPVKGNEHHENLMSISLGEGKGDASISLYRSFFLVPFEIIEYIEFVHGKNDPQVPPGKVVVMILFDFARPIITENALSVEDDD